MDHTTAWAAGRIRRRRGRRHSFMNGACFEVYHMANRWQRMSVLKSWATDSSPALSNYFLNVLHNGKDLIFRYAITRTVSLHVPDLVQSILYNITLWNYKELKTLFQHHSYVHYEWFKTQKFYGALYLSKRTLKPTDRETVSSLELTNNN